MATFHLLCRAKWTTKALFVAFAVISLAHNVNAAQVQMRLWCEYALYFSTLIFHHNIFISFGCMFVQSNLSVEQTGFSFLSHWITIHQMPETQTHNQMKLTNWNCTEKWREAYNHKMRWMCKFRLSKRKTRSKRINGRSCVAHLNFDFNPIYPLIR